MHRDHTESEVGNDPAERTLLPHVPDSELSLSLLTLPAGAETVIAEPEQDSLLYVRAGSGRIGDANAQLVKGAAALVAAGEAVSISADSEGLTALWARAGAGCDRHAPLGDTVRVAHPEPAGTDSATGSRSFQIPLGPHNGSCRATLFVGYVPPGRAPWHFHQYDEIVCILEGSGRYHTSDRSKEAAADAAFRIRPRDVHILENLGDEELVLLGVFTPAGSPAAAYLASAPEDRATSATG